MASQTLSGKRVAFLVAPEGIEQVELTEPWKAVEAAGGSPELLSTDSGEMQAFNHLDKARHVPRRPHGRRGRRVRLRRRSCCRAASPTPTSCAPTRTPSPSCARSSSRPSRSRRSATRPWTLIEADVVKGRTLTSWPSLQTDLRNAGAKWVDEEVVVDQGLVTSRNPDDLQAFCAKVVEEICEGEHAAQARSA